MICLAAAKRQTPEIRSDKARSKKSGSRKDFCLPQDFWSWQSNSVAQSECFYNTERGGADGKYQPGLRLQSALATDGHVGLAIAHRTCGASHRRLTASGARCHERTLILRPDERHSPGQGARWQRGSALSTRLGSFTLQTYVLQREAPQADLKVSTTNTATYEYATEPNKRVLG